MPDVNRQQSPLKTLIMRGGTSRGPFFNAADLPEDIALRDRILLAAMGSPDTRQIDGLGGATPLTSKAGIVGRSRRPGIDLEFRFAQIQPGSESVDTKPNCGNMLAAVVPFALETGLLLAQGSTTTARVLTLNTGMQCDITVDTPDGLVVYEGESRIDGVPGTAAPVKIQFLETAGSVCASLLPTGNVVDYFHDIDDIASIDATCIDNGMPLVILNACDVDCTGYETAAELNANTLLKSRLELLRLAAGIRMGLGDVTDKSYPKMTLVAGPSSTGNISTRSFIPHVCHDAIGVLAALTVATAAVLPGSVAQAVASVPEGLLPSIGVEHPAGEFRVELTLDADNPQQVNGAALLRTARLIMRGEVMIPSTTGMQKQLS